jgi:hypothetical protein
MIVYLLVVVLAKDVKITVFRSADACVESAQKVKTYDQKECLKKGVLINGEE